ncbi:MAG: P-II family nitrogen regulator [Oscillospiraceae bacterium]|nr:P-II family nitrogen regulator [Oscillospiraceae bacterium]
MRGYSFVLAVIKREQDEEYIRFFKRFGAQLVLSTLCEGAARKKTLDMLGLEQNEKLLVSCIVPGCQSAALLRRLQSEMHIDAPNNGIAIIICLESVGGASALRSLCREEAATEDEVKEMKTAEYSLIVAVAQQGHTGEIMDAARGAGARGGTIIRARGTLTSSAEKFFGISLAEDKELLYIVTRRCDRDAIMSSIMHNAGINSPSHAFVFSLPVEAVAGVSFPECEEA